MLSGSWRGRASGLHRAGCWYACASSGSSVCMLPHHAVVAMGDHHHVCQVLRVNGYGDMQSSPEGSLSCSYSETFYKRISKPHSLPPVLAQPPGSDPIFWGDPIFFGRAITLCFCIQLVSPLTTRPKHVRADPAEHGGVHPEQAWGQHVEEGVTTIINH